MRKDKKPLLLIFPALPKYLPYVCIYEDILNRNNIEFDILCWNRKGDEIEYKKNVYTFDKTINDRDFYLIKFFLYLRFFLYVFSHLKQQQYNRIIVSTISLSLCMLPLLVSFYKNKYIFDIRDNTSVMNIKVVRMLFNMIVKNSMFTSISSAGFCTFLPKNANYVITHNVVPAIMNQKYKVTDSISYPIKIGTIGLLRVEPNIVLMKELGNKIDYDVRFYGRSDANSILEEYSKKNRLYNVSFYGWYPKSEEPNIVAGLDFLSIYLCHDINSDILMTNRIYLGALFRKPMIVNANTFQGIMVKKYKMGVLIDDEKQIETKIASYVEKFNSIEFDKGCQDFLDMVYNDMKNYEDKLVNNLL